MKSTGEMMSIGRTFEEALLKGLRSLEIGVRGLDGVDMDDEELIDELKHATDRRIFVIGEAIRRGWRTDRIAELAQWDGFYVDKLRNIVAMERRIAAEELTPELLGEAKAMGFSDDSIGRLIGRDALEVRLARKAMGHLPLL